jgi:hypothetical protein
VKRWGPALALGTALAGGFTGAGATALDGPGDAAPRTESPSPIAREFAAVAERLEAGPNNQFLGPAFVEDLRRELAGAELGSPGDLKARVDLAHAFLRDGENDAAIELLGVDIDAYEEGELPADVADVDIAEVYRARALAHLRKAEVQNCVARHEAQCCIYPLAGGGLHTVDGPARAARRDYESYLKLVESTDRVRARLGAIWLLNIATMAVGDSLEDLPEAYRLPAFPESDRDLGTFVDVATQAGVAVSNLAGGAVVDDIDGDGRLDIVTSTCDPRGSLRFFRNRGDGTFADLTEVWRLTDQLGGLQLTAADYDNDGRLDLFVPRGAWLYESGHIRHSLLHNTPAGFVDVTRAAGLGKVPQPSQVAVWADFDNDGCLDLFTPSESSVQIEVGAPNLPSQLYHSNGDGTFDEVAAEAGVTNDRFAKGACAGDYDGDGDMDLFVANYGRDRLYRNDTVRGEGLRFTDVAEQAGVIGPTKSFASWFFDYDDDGDLDLWICAYEGKTPDVVRSLLGESDADKAMCLYRNKGDGTFENAAPELGLTRTWLPMGASFGDLDNDGWLDVYLGTGDPNYETLTPNVALRNDGGKRFEEVTRTTGLGHLQKGHGVVFADIDDDGDQDIYHELGGFYLADAFPNALFRNPGQGNRWLKVELVGVETNRQAIGARVEVEVETPSGPRTLHRAVGSVASFGNTPRRQEIGLGDATAIREVRVWWPTSGRRQTFALVPLESCVRITEGAESFERVELHPVALAAASDDAGAGDSPPRAP